MLLFCPLCQSAFTGVARCPRCSGLLLMPEEAPPGTEPGEAAPEPFNPTPAGRVAVGTIVALGLYLALRKLVTGWVILEGNEAEDWWRSGDALLTVFILQMTAAAFGALLAATGRAQGITLGVAVGGLCGALFLVAEVTGGAPLVQLVLLLQPVILAVGGAIAGAVGSWVWSPVPELDM